MLLYYFTEQRQVTLRCPSTNGWTSRTETLSDAGIIQNASSCSITTNELRALPELHGKTQSAISSTHIYVPDKISIVADHEIPLIKQLLPAEVKQLEEVKSKVMVPSQSFDVDSLFHIRVKQATLHQTHQTYWKLIAISTVCDIAIRGILFLSFRSSLHNMATRCFFSRTVPEPSTAEHNPSSPRLNRDKEPTLQTKTTLSTMSHLRLIHFNQLATYTEICF